MLAMYGLFKKKHIVSAFKYLVILLLIVVLIFPIYWMVVSSFQRTDHLMNLPPQFWPRNIFISNYTKIFSNAVYLTYFKNSFITAAGTVLVVLLISIPTGYAFSRYHFFGKNVILTSILTVQMFPIVVILMSLYTFYMKWKLLNTYRGLILADTTFALPLTVMLMKAFFDTLPRSLDDAASIDGAGRLHTLVTILLPLTLPSLVAVGCYTFLNTWDDFLMALVIMQRDSMKTLTVGLAQSFLGEYSNDYGALMAFSVAGSLPIVLLFVFFQKYMISGLTTGAVKG